MAGGDEALDPEVLGEMLAELGEEVALDVVTAFKEEGRKLSAALLEAVRRGDLEDARRHAHALKGSALAVGANRLGEACRSFETIPPDEAMAAGMEMEVQLERATREVDGWTARLEGR